VLPDFEGSGLINRAYSYAAIDSSTSFAARSAVVIARGQFRVPSWRWLTGEEERALYRFCQCFRSALASNHERSYKRREQMDLFASRCMSFLQPSPASVLLLSRTRLQVCQCSRCDVPNAAANQFFCMPIGDHAVIKATFSGYAVHKSERHRHARRGTSIWLKDFREPSA